MPRMNSEDQIRELQADLDACLNTLKLVMELNTLGKTKQIADEIQPILKHYNR